MYSPLATVPISVIKTFNEEVTKLVTLLKKEFPQEKQVKVLSSKINLVLSGSKRALFDLFATHVKPQYGEKICSLDMSLVTDVQRSCEDDEDAAQLMPTIISLWNTGGKETKQPEMLQKKILIHLRNLCQVN